MNPPIASLPFKKIPKIEHFACQGSRERRCVTLVGCRSIAVHRGPC